MSAIQETQRRVRPPRLPVPRRSYAEIDPRPAADDLPLLSDSQVIMLPTSERAALPRLVRRSSAPSLGALFLSAAAASAFTVMALSFAAPQILAAASAWSRPSSDTPQSRPAARAYVVAAGDTLSLIAARELGDAKLWPEILAANRDRLSSPATLEIGTRLELPERRGSDRSLPPGQKKNR